MSHKRQGIVPQGVAPEPKLEPAPLPEPVKEYILITLEGEQFKLESNLANPERLLRLIGARLVLRNEGA